MNNFKIEIKWSLIFTLVTLLWMLLEKTAGLHTTYIGKHPLYSSLFIIPTIALYYLALKNKKEAFFNGTMTWKQGVVSGIYIAFLIAVLSPIAQLITATLISPDFFKNAIAYAVENNLMTEAAANDYFNLKSYMIQGAFGALSLGVVISAIMAYFLQTKKLK